MPVLYPPVDSRTTSKLTGTIEKVLSKEGRDHVWSKCQSISPANLPLRKQLAEECGVPFIKINNYINQKNRIRGKASTVSAPPVPVVLSGAALALAVEKDKLLFPDFSHDAVLKLHQLYNLDPRAPAEEVDTWAAPLGLNVDRVRMWLKLRRAAERASSTTTQHDQNPQVKGEPRQGDDEFEAEEDVKPVIAQLPTPRPTISPSIPVAPLVSDVSQNQTVPMDWSPRRPSPTPQPAPSATPEKAPTPLPGLQSSSPTSDSDTQMENATAGPSTLRRPPIFVNIPSTSASAPGPLPTPTSSYGSFHIQDSTLSSTASVSSPLSALNATARRLSLGGLSSPSLDPKGKGKEIGTEVGAIRSKSPATQTSQPYPRPVSSSGPQAAPAMRRRFTTRDQVRAAFQKMKEAPPPDLAAYIFKEGDDVEEVRRRQKERLEADIAQAALLTKNLTTTGSLFPTGVRH